MKQLRNIVAPIFLLCLMAVAQSAGLSTGTAGRCDPAGAEGEYGQCKRDRVRTYWRLIRMAYHNVG